MWSKRTTFYAIATISTFVGVCILFARFLNHPAIEWYTSAPLNAEGLRAKVLVPYGWTLVDGESKLPTGNLHRDERVTFVFSEQESSFQRWLRRFFRQPAKPDASLSVDIAYSLEEMGLNPENPADGKLDNTNMPFSTTSLCLRTIKIGKPSIYGLVAYIDSDVNSYRSKRAVICRSFNFR